MGPVSLVGNSEAAGGVVKHRGTLFAECCTGPVSLVGNSEAAGGVVKHRGTLFAECCTAPMSLVGGFRGCRRRGGTPWNRSEEHTAELQSLMRISYAIFCLKT